jgi:hypothetical protein
LDCLFPRFSLRGIDYPRHHQFLHQFGALNILERRIIYERHTYQKILEKLGGLVAINPWLCETTCVGQFAEKNQAWFALHFVQRRIESIDFMRLEAFVSETLLFSQSHIPGLLAYAKHVTAYSERKTLHLIFDRGPKLPLGFRRIIHYALHTSDLERTMNVVVHACPCLRRLTRQTIQLIPQTSPAQMSVLSNKENAVASQSTRLPGEVASCVKLKITKHSLTTKMNRKTSRKLQGSPKANRDFML